MHLLLCALSSSQFEYNMCKNDDVYVHGGASFGVSLSGSWKVMKGGVDMVDRGHSADLHPYGTRQGVQVRKSANSSATATGATEMARAAQALHKQWSIISVDTGGA